MTRHRERAALVKRLEQLEHSLGEKLQDMADRLAHHHRQEAEQIQSKSQVVRSKVADVDDDGWDAVKQDLEADWNILNHLFERWVEDTDREYQSRS